MHSARKAKNADGSNVKERESILDKLARYFDTDKMEADEDSVLPGNFQMMNIGECLFGFYNLS